MKRLTRTEDSVESLTEISLNEPDVPGPKVDLKELPKRVLGHDLKSMKSFKQKRRNYRFKSQGQLFIHDVGIVLEQYDPQEHEFDLELLTTVLDIAESFFIHGSDKERKDQKRDAISQLMKVYFRDDDTLLELMVQSVWKKVRKSTYMKRKWCKLKSLFF